MGRRRGILTEIDREELSRGIAKKLEGSRTSTHHRSDRAGRAMVVLAASRYRCAAMLIGCDGTRNRKLAQLNLDELAYHVGSYFGALATIVDPGATHHHLHAARQRQCPPTFRNPARAAARP